MVWVNDRQAPMGQPNATGKPKALAIRAPVLLRLRHGCQKLSVNWMSVVSMKYTGKTAHELRAGLFNHLRHKWFGWANLGLQGPNLGRNSNTRLQMRRQY
jgi:hypothetical protein